MKSPDLISSAYVSRPAGQSRTEACSEGCAGFRRLPQEGWSDYGLCKNPRSPRYGSPVRIGRDCPYSLALSPSRPD
jgi:hypothetical protein